MPANTGEAGNAGLIPRLGRSLGVGNGHPLQYSCLENPMHVQRSLVGYRPRGCKELDTIEQLSMQALIMQLFFFLKDNKTILLGFWFKNFH